MHFYFNLMIFFAQYHKICKCLFLSSCNNIIKQRLQGWEPPHKDPISQCGVEQNGTRWEFPKILFLALYSPWIILSYWPITVCLTNKLAIDMIQYENILNCGLKTIGTCWHKHTCLHNGLVRTPAEQYLLKY